VSAEGNTGLAGARKAARRAESLHNRQLPEHRTEMQHGKSLPGKWFCSTKPDKKTF